MRRLAPLFAAVLALSACPSEPTEQPDAAIPSGEDAGTPDASGPALGPVGAEVTDELCGNGQDDDQNGYGDCSDFWCRDSLAVSACDSLENTAAKCADGQDNAESPRGPNASKTDGLVDCADPDCAKNPFLAGVCPERKWEFGDAACSNGADDDGDGKSDCEDLDCLAAGASQCGLGGRKRVLFDDAHRQRAGSADWVLDAGARLGWPTVPQAETEWAGALSSFGTALVATGRFVVETLPSRGAALTFQDAANPQDLSRFDVLVLAEPSAGFSEAEADAVAAFAKAGGGVLMVADHADSDRDGNGWDSVSALNKLFERAGGGVAGANPFGFTVANVDYAQSGRIEGVNHGETGLLAEGAASHPVIDGPHGKVAKVGMHKGGLFALNPGATNVTVLLHAVPASTQGYEQGSPYVVAAQVEAGRAVAVGDSAILNDGTDSHGWREPGFDSWHDSQEQNAALFLNAVEWLAKLK